MRTDEVLRLIQEVAEQVINPRFRDLSDGQITEKNPGDLVTVADREAEVLLTEALTAAYPGAVVLGEEAYSGDPGLLDRYASAEHAFTVDPVDGTKNFVHGSRDHAVMVGEVVDGIVVRGWIWQPQHQVGYVAERGGGAWRDGQRLRRTPPSDEATGWQGVTSHRAWVGRHFGDLPALDLTWVCCGVDYPKLIEGATDYIRYRHGMPWDHVPGSLLAAESGAVVRLADGDPYDPRRIAEHGLLVAADERMIPVLAGLGQGQVDEDR